MGIAARNYFGNSAKRVSGHLERRDTLSTEQDVSSWAVAADVEAAANAAGPLRQAPARGKDLIGSFLCAQYLKNQVSKVSQLCMSRLLAVEITVVGSENF